MFLNPLSVGYESIAEIGILTDLSDKEKVKESLKNKPSVRVASPIGKYDISGQIFARKFNDLSTLVRQIDIKPFVKSLDVLIFADLWDNPWHPENLVIPPKEKGEKKVSKPKKSFEPTELDEIDLKICKALMQNSRVPFKSLSQQIGISTSNIIQRYRSLRERNVLNLSSITVDPSKLGYKANVDSYIKVTNRGSMAEVEAQLLEIPNLTFCAKFIGGTYDLRIAVNARDFNDVNSLKKAIYSIDNIKHAEFYIFVNPTRWPTDFIGGSLI